MSELDTIASEKITVSRAMIKHGGSFVSALGKALEYADFSNAWTIKAAFNDYWHKYLEIGKEQGYDKD
jgi:hypothetical protein